MSIKIKLNNDWVDTNIQAVRGVNHVNSEDVYTKEETEKKFATKTEVQTQINNSITKENIENTIEAWLEEDNESTNGEVYTKQESDVLFSGKVSKADIVQTTGTSTTSVMSQKAVTDSVNAEKTAREAADTALGERTTALETKLANYQVITDEEVTAMAEKVFVNLSHTADALDNGGSIAFVDFLRKAADHFVNLLTFNDTAFLGAADDFLDSLFDLRHAQLCFKPLLGNLKKAGIL